VAVARPEECTFSKDDINLLQQVASQMAIELNNALVVEARNRAEDALRRSQAYLAEAQRLSHSGSWGLRREGIQHVETDVPARGHEIKRRSMLCQRDADSHRPAGTAMTIASVGLRVFVCENLAFHGEYTPPAALLVSMR